MRRYSFLLILVLLAQVVLPSGMAVGTPGPDIIVSTESINFGNVPVGTFSSQVTIIVTNIGDADLIIYDLEITGTNANQFFIASINATSPIIPPGESVSGNVQFAPTSIGLKTAWFNIYTNDPCGGTTHIVLKGTGVPPPPAEPDIDVSPTSVTFTPSVTVGNTSPPETVTIRNTGTANLTIGTITLTGTNPGDFLISSDNASGKTLPPGTATTVQVQFKPTDTGSRTASLEIPSNDPDEDPVSIPLSGTGTTPPPDIQVSPLSIDFGDVYPGSKSGTRIVTITNIGGSNLNIGTINLKGYDPGHFEIVTDNASNKSLAPGVSANVSVRFSPKTPDYKEAELQIPSDAQSGLAKVDLEGFGLPTEPGIWVNPDKLDFGSILVNSSSAPKTVTIMNTGTADLILGTIYLGDADAGHFSIVTDNASGKTLPPGAWVTVSVRFNPTGPFTRQAGLYIPNNVYTSDEYVLLKGYGIPIQPLITVDPYQIDFGAIQVGSSSSWRTVTITNVGTADLQIYSIELQGFDAGHFQISSDNASNKTLPPGTATTVSVRFSPGSAGYKTAELYIPNDDLDVWVDLEGTGYLGPFPDIDVSPMSVTFTPPVALGDTSAPETVTIRNTGTANLTIGTITLTGANQGDFLIFSDNASGKTLTPDTATTVQVQFSPTAVGSRNASLKIPSNDADENPTYVTLTGTGIAPDIDVTPTSVTFTPSVLIGDTSDPETVTIRNIGTADLIIGTITLTGANPGDFLISSDNASGKTLPPGTAATVQVRFKPTDIGSRTASLEIPSNDPDEDPVNVPLSGTGTVPATVYGTVFEDTNGNGVQDTGEDGIPGVTISLGSTDNITDSLGQYTFKVEIAGVYTVTETDPAGYFSTTSNNVSVNVELGNSYPVDFGDAPITSSFATIYGTVFDDTSGNGTQDGGEVGIPGVTISLGSTDNITDSLGRYTFKVETAGVYTVTETDPAGYFSTTPNNVNVNVELGHGYQVDFGDAIVVPDITVSPMDINCGFIQVGVSSSSYNVTVTNDGTANLTIGTITLAGANPGDFTIVSDNASGQILIPGASANVSVRFNPATTGSKNAQLQIPSNDPDENPVSVTLSGYGSPVPVPDIDVMPSSISFSPPVVLGNTSTAVTVTIRNTGTANLTIGTITLAGANPGDFIISSDNASGKSLPPGTATTVQVSFKPTNTGARAGSLEIPSDDPDEDPVYVPLSGTGIEPDIEVTPLSVDFGFLLIGDTSAPRIVAVTNNGTADLTIGLISITGPDAPQFAIVSDNASSQVLAPGASANVSVNFTPSAAALQSANMTIPSDDPDENPVNVLLSGTGTVTPPKPDIDVSPPNINYGSINVGSSSAAITVIITNTGTANLVIGAITLAGSNPGDFVVSSDNASGKSLPPGTVTTVQVSFKPTATGLRNASLQIPSNDPDEATVNVTLSGTGTTAPPPTPPGGSSSYQPAPRYFTVDFLGEITREVATDDGRPIKRMEAPSPDGTHLVEIEAYTGATDNTGAMVTLIEIREAAAPELPENTVLVGKAYQFKPQGTKFDKDIWLTLGYNVTDLPEYVVAVGAAYYTVEDGWTYLETETTSVAELGKLRAPVGHFTIFAVLATVSVPTPPEPTTLPPEKPEPPKPEVTEPPPAPAMFKLSNLSVTVSVTRFFENVAYIVITGEDAFITVDVTNTGGQPGRYTAILIINGEERDRKDVALEPGQTETLTFIVADNEPGIYTVVIGDLSGDFLSQFRINWWLISGSAAALVLVICLVWYLVRRKRHQPI